MSLPIACDYNMTWNRAHKIRRVLVQKCTRYNCKTFEAHIVGYNFDVNLLYSSFHRHAILTFVVSFDPMWKSLVFIAPLCVRSILFILKIDLMTDNSTSLKDTCMSMLHKVSNSSFWKVWMGQVCVLYIFNQLVNMARIKINFYLNN